MKQFTIPFTYRSERISAIKEKRKTADKMKKDFEPTFLEFGQLKIQLARHFGFCYGVENAIEIAFRTIDENEGKRIFLLSEMIHNPQVNADLLNRGVRFLQDTTGNKIIDIEELTQEDVVIIPAFGTTLAMEEKLRAKGIAVEKYNTTCPFVEKVWNRSAQIAKKEYSIIIHGKPSHEETRATFSHAAADAPSVVVENMEEAILLGKYISGDKDISNFYIDFANRYSTGFDAEKHLQRIGVVNQTTMLASDTQAISDYLKSVITARYNLDDTTVENHFADTRDTLCYATNDNQSAVLALREKPADLAIVVGGYNSSNTSHLVELLEEKMTTYYISGPDCLLNENSITHFDMHKKVELITEDYLPNGKQNITVSITSGASCPDAVVNAVIERLDDIINS